VHNLIYSLLCKNEDVALNHQENYEHCSREVHRTSPVIIYILNIL
jgi:hypothetical protein